MADDIHRMSDELARDPSSRVFAPLGEALRKQGQHDLAMKVAMRGLERHPHFADGHDLLARLSIDANDLERAFDEWDMVLRLAPGHPGALKGMGFVCFQRERFAEAEQYLSAAAAADPTDEQVATALSNLRVTQAPSGGAAPSHDDPRFLFSALLSDEGQTALLLDRDGLVLGGAYLAWDGRDVAQEVGAQLSGVTEAARRTTRHLTMGDWTSIVFETEVAVVAMAPSADDGLLVLATSRATPLGLVRRLLDRCTAHASSWLGTRR